MDSPTAKNHQPRGFTLIELFVVVLVIGVLYSIVVLALKPEELKEKARDVVRIGDINKLSAAVEAYVADHGSLPDLPNLARSSLIPVGSGPVARSNGQGWIGQDLSRYLEKLPIDPLNDSNHFYRYKQNGIRFEIDAPIEYYTDVAANDGGNDPSRYEKGTDLAIL